jgi:4-oxalocrotonate tautomerase family enzyme
MPYVNVRIAKTGATSEQKAKLIKGITDLLFDVLAKPKASTYVVIDEVELDNWGVGGETLTQIRKPK